MASNKQHHVSKSNRFTVILAREEDAAGSRSFRIIPWLLISGFFLVALLIGTAAYALVTLTPLAVYVPLPNPALEHKYSQELLGLNVRMLGLMEELVQLRTYNVKLRSALGERLSSEDSSAAAAAAEVRAQAPSPQITENIIPKADLTAGGDIRRDASFPQVVKVVDRMAPVSFPAIVPSQGYVTREFSPESGHMGLDIAAKTGAIVSAAADGTILFSGWTEGDGNMLVVAHSGGFVTVYKHNNSLLLAVGAIVKRGEAIATVGNTGRTSFGPHLHFEIWKDGICADPARYLINLTL